MKTNTLRKLSFLLVLVTFAVGAATISRIKNFSDGEILTASDLNAEFNNTVDGVNSITNDNIASNAALSPAKISSAIKGNAINRNGTSGALSVKVDNVGVEIVSDNLALKDGGVTGAKLNANVVDNVTLQQTGTTLNVKDDGITTAKIIDSAVTFVKTGQRSSPGATAALGQVALSAASGSYSTTSSSATDVTNMSVSITTKGGPVIVQGIAGAAHSTLGPNLASGSSNGVSGYVYFNLNGVTGSGEFISTVSGAADFNGRGISLPCSSVKSILFPSAGTHTIKMQVSAAVATSMRFSVMQCRLLAYEL